MTLRLEMAIGAHVAQASLDDSAAPATCAALGALLPFEGSAHLAKLAGDEIMVHVPIILDTERRRAVADLSEGAVAFWPERQVFCVYFGRIQDEDADVTFLGHVDEGLDELAAAAEDLRHVQGRSVVSLRLEALDGPEAGKETPAQSSRTLSQPKKAYLEIRDREPEDLRILLARSGVMRPVGPLLYAEAECRKLHELLWLLRAEFRSRGSLPVVTPAIVRHSVRRLVGWYGLKDSGRVVTDSLATLERLPSQEALPFLEDLILYVGKLSFWLDAFVPWVEFNRVMQAPVGERG